MKSFQKQHTVTQKDLDSLKHVNNVQYVQWVQDIAEAHWKSKVSKSIDEMFFWVMIKHTITYKNQAFLNDSLKLTTYVTSCKGVTSTRIVEIFNETTNALCAISETKWCLMSKSNNKPARIHDEIATLFC